MALLLLLLVVIALFIVLRSCAADKPAATPTPTSVSTEQPGAAVTDVPTPTQAPRETAEPTPVSTPEPTPEPTPAAVDAFGSFKSETGAGIELVADWSATGTGDGKAIVIVTLSVESYSLQCRDIWNGATVVIDGSPHSVTTAAVDYDGSDVGKNELGSINVTLPLAADGSLNVPVSATWNFKGSYGDQTFSSISASGNIVAG
ncbi:MAG: hypothetical protein RRY09_04480 [Oscillospiraceae bacterium]